MMCDMENKYEWVNEWMNEWTNLTLKDPRCSWSTTATERVSQFLIFYSFDLLFSPNVSMTPTPAL